MQTARASRSLGQERQSRPCAGTRQARTLVQREEVGALDLVLGGLCAHAGFLCVSSVRGRVLSGAQTNRVVADTLRTRSGE
jgi:hypothetical protein